VQVDENSKAGTTSPAYSSIQVLQLTIHVWVALERSQCPVPNGDSDVVHASSGNLIKIIRRHKGGPVLREHRSALVRAEGRAQRPLINGGVTGIIEDGRGDPRLQYQPASEVDTTNLVISIGESGVGTASS
jgi:hypothetical protein